MDQSPKSTSPTPDKACLASLEGTPDKSAAEDIGAYANAESDAASMTLGENPESGGSLGALAPGWWEPEDGSEPEPWLTKDEALERFLDWVAASGLDPWPHQEDALMELALGNNVILGTPTGSGKSLVALGLHFLALATGRRSYYTAPIKALVSEKFFNLVEVLGRENVGMITGDVALNTQAPVICCTAEILANDALREGAGADVGCVIMDEFHFYGDPDRGWAWQIPLLTLPNTQFLLMSATLGDVTAIAENLEEHTGRPTALVLDAPRPVPLTYEYVDTALEGTVELALRKGEAPIYIVHFSQDGAIASAQALASYGVAGKSQREAVKKAMAGTAFTTAFGKILKRLLECGVGVHHAGMLPRYRLLVEKMAQQGLLPVICGTDTLGVGINVPIHTVLLTQLTKFDGEKMRRLKAREFHQIAGRAGRSGFDEEGMVIAQAPEHEIENAKLVRKAGNDPKKLRKIKKKKPPEGFVTWDEKTFDKLIHAAPEKLKPHLRFTHSMVLAVVSRGGDAWAEIRRIIEDSAQSEEQKADIAARAREIIDTLIQAGVIVETVDDEGNHDFSLTIDLPDDFALDQPLSPFLLEALDLLDPESETYALDVISIAEATLENPRQVLRAQEHQARDRAMAEMKADGIDYEERLERLSEITYPKPLEDLLGQAFDIYCKAVPWARDHALEPKSVLRDMIETASDFKGYVNRYGLARSEGTLLRYLSDAYRVLDKTLPLDARDEKLDDIIAWLGFMVRTTDSSLVDEWESAGTAQPQAQAYRGFDEVVRDRHGLEVLIRNALFARVRAAAKDDAEALGRMDGEWGFGERRWREALDAYYGAHESAAIDGDARSKAYFEVDEGPEKAQHAWRVRQIFSDPEGDRDFAIWATVDLDATQETGEAVFSQYRVGFIEDLLEAGGSL